VLSLGGAAHIRTFSYPEKKELVGETRLPSGQKNRAVDSHYGGALGGDMAPLRELSNIAAFFGLCECGHGGPSFVLHQTRSQDSL
jgi:hypothetical protein